MESGELNPSALAASFTPIWIDDSRDAAAVRAAAEQHRKIVLTVLLAILDRYDRRREFHLVDTKLDILSGRDFATDDPLRGPNTVFAWIQGRGLEALAGHAQWIATADFLAPVQRESVLQRIRVMMGEVMAEMERIRAINGGRLTFMMTREGTPLEVDESGQVRRARSWSPSSPASFSDLFYAKGLAAAAAYLNDRRSLDCAQSLLLRTFEDISHHRFVSDQQPMDPKNPVRAVEGRRPQGPWMITVGAAELLLRLTQDPRYVDMGQRCIEHILQHHVKLDGRGPAFCQQYDMWEFVDVAGRPFLEQGLLRADPGHATEFAGLGLKFLRTCGEMGVHIDQCTELAETLCGVLRRNFHNGFCPAQRGLCKAYDLVGGQVINSDMPWWSMPETIRAAMEAHAISAPARKPDFADIARQCSNAFLKYYVRADRHLMANQTIEASGNPAAVVPATPDADPGYHTGLSLIGALGLLRLCSVTVGPHISTLG